LISEAEMATTDQQQHEEELVDYDEEDQDQTAEKDVAADGAQKRGNYVAIHSSGFRDFFLKAELLRAIGDAGFEHPSEVQNECIPQAITGSDILCQAKSGMGKTAVFVISALQQLNPTENAVLVLVIAHTRELAFQIKNEFDRFSKHLSGIRTDVVYGGTPVPVDIAKVTGDKIPHILIGTPGRLLGLCKATKDAPRGPRTGRMTDTPALNLDKLKHFVIDECDKVLEKLDMRQDVMNIYGYIKRKPQIMMFSATMNSEMRDLCKKMMQNPLEIFVDDETKLTLHGLLQYYCKLKESEKNRKLNDILDKLEFNQVIIFVKSASRAQALSKLLNECNFPTVCIHANMKQEERIKMYLAFKKFEHRIMVATDLFGRGIDIERVNIVINYDMPEASDSYLHRVGRAGRFGTKGLAITFTTDSEEDKRVLEDVQRRFDVKIPEMPDHIDSQSYINA